MPALRSDPKLAADLAWAGFDLVSRANNHAWDYGAIGLRETTRRVAAAGLTQAGAGESLAAARQAGVFTTPRGAVALVSATSTFPDDGRAGNPRGPIPARPGVSPLRFRRTDTVTPAELENLRAIARDLGENPPASGDRLDFAGRLFVAGPQPGVSTEPDPGDLEAIAAEVRRARTVAAYTIVAIHCHEPGRGGRETPPPFLVAFAHAMVDAGADLVVGHGPHVLQGIEVYRGRPIFYSLGNFLFEYETVAELPADDYESVGLPPTAKPDDFFDRYDRGGASGYPADRDVWESAVVRTRWTGRRIDAVELFPITLGFGLARRERGEPRPADAEAARRILERLARLSAPFGTKIEIGPESGRLILPPAP